LEKNCIRQKQVASNPETPVFPLMASNAKTIDGEQKSLVRTLISHNLAQFCTICTIFAQFCSVADGLLYSKANRFKPRKAVFQFCAQMRKQIVQAKNPLPKPSKP
jgi:hypothetical protein